MNPSPKKGGAESVRAKKAISGRLELIDIETSDRWHSKSLLI